MSQHETRAEQAPLPCVVARPYPGCPGYFAPCCSRDGRSLGGRWSAAEMDRLLRLTANWPFEMEPERFAYFAKDALEGRGDA